MTPDVAVVGGGIVGCALAAFLAEGGAQVVLYEREAIAAGASGRNSGVVQDPLDPALTGLYEESLEHYRDARPRLRAAGGAGRPAAARRPTLEPSREFPEATDLEGAPRAARAGARRRAPGATGSRPAARSRRPPPRTRWRPAPARPARLGSATVRDSATGRRDRDGELRPPAR